MRLRHSFLLRDVPALVHVLAHLRHLHSVRHHSKLVTGLHRMGVVVKWLGPNLLGAHELLVRTLE